MLCDECKLNQAVIEMNVMINGQQKHLHLCEECYAKMKNNFGMPSFSKAEHLHSMICFAV
ncbi:ClpB protein [Sporolactobacillus inulinus]|uniref:ClpB protein n=1 Tax=Sporolactobacillus inulinus TaxID=2078 RepID=A0A4Y1ZII3_9BACL|nr:ClpB protein [Sporolactobacillus inulinus]